VKTGSDNKRGIVWGLMPAGGLWGCVLQRGHWKTGRCMMGKAQRNVLNSDYG